MKKTIVIVSWFGESETGGVEFVTYYMHQIWGEEYNVKIIDYSELKKNRLYSILLKKHYVIDALLFSIYTNGYIKKLKQKLGAKNVIVVTQGYNAPFVKADLAFSHGTMRGFEMSALGIKKWDYYERFEKISWNNAKKIIAVGNHAKHEAVEFYGVDSEKIEVIENCIDTDIFYPKERKETEKIKVLFCGRLTPQKNPKKVLELAKAIENDNRFELTIATPSNENTDMFKSLKKTTLIVGLKKTEMNDFYNSGNVMFFPSLYEGFELVTVECLSSGIPVLGNRVGAVGDFYEAGRLGVAISTGNINSDLDMLYNMAVEYTDINKRELLHKQMIKYQNFELYKERMLNAIKKVSE